jgi:UDP:flavonoid glycosyltransferase YjiC (YdhE family)
MSRRILLATFGTLGDIYPFVAMAKALAARGLEPLIAAPAMRHGLFGQGLPIGLRWAGH